ncbi:MAG: hypothetical protein ACT6FG_00315 [Methanosarcinaceae archaeon]
MKYEIKISNATNGVPATTHSKEEVMNIIDALLGVDGIKRLTITGTPEPIVEKPAKYQVQECAITSHPNQDVTELLKTVTDNPIEEQKTKIFTEIKPIKEKDFGKYIDLFADGMGYHDQNDGSIVIKRGVTKVYTTLKTMKELPCPIPKKLISHLSRPKQIAIKHFKEWIEQGLPNIYVDPDAEFKPQLHQDTIVKDSGDYENTSGGYGH